MKEKQANRRIRLLLAVFILVFAVTLARAVWLQGVRAAELGKMAERQHHESIVIPAGRGTIFDRAGVQLAIGEATTTVYADPRQVRAPRAIAAAAQRFFGVDANTLYPQLLDRRSSFLYVKRFADPAAAEAMLKKGYLGVNSYPEERRATTRTRRARSSSRCSGTARSPTRMSPGRRSSSSRSRARSPTASSPRRRSSPCRTRSASPTASSTTPSRAGRRRSRSRRSC